MIKYATRLTAAALAALALVGVAKAAPAPSVGSIAATGLQAGAAGATVHRQELSVGWALGAGEYACAIRVGGTEGETVDPLAPDASSWAGAIGATPGTTIAITLSYVAIPAGVTVQPADACFRPRSTASTTAVAQAYATPEPAPAPIAPIAAPTEPEPGPTVEDRLTELERLLAELSARITALETATLAAWTALVDTLAAGATPDVAALAARSAYLNHVYGL